jgi:hypothetical protein
VATLRVAATAVADEKSVYFLNQAPQAKDASARKPVQVLTRFKMQETGPGPELRVDDADGSRYDGLVVSQRAGPNSFRVTGTNKTLQQPVVFTGQYFRIDSPQMQQQQLRLAPEQVRVQGQAVVGTNNQVQVDAQAPTPAN